MIRILLFGIFLLGYFPSFFSQDEEFDKSVLLLEEGKGKKAMVAIDKAIKINGDSSKYYMLKAEIDYEINKDLNGFFQLLNKSIDVEPENPIPVINRAHFYDMAKQDKNAILDYNDALKLAKVDSIIHLVLVARGSVYWSVRKHNLAKEDLYLAYQLDSNNIFGMNSLAMCLDDLGETSEANRILKRMVVVDSTFFPAWMNLGFHSSVHEDYEAALIYFDKAISLSGMENDSYPIIINNRGYTKLKLGDVEGALKDVKKSLKLNPSNSYAYRNLALVYLKLEDKDKACENLVLAKRYGYSKNYGDDVDEMLKDHCGE